MGRFLSSTTLVATGVIYILLIIPRTCDGAAADFFCPALTVIFIVNLLIVVLTGYFKWRQRKIRFNFIPIYVSLILFAIVISIKFFNSGLFKGRVMIEARATETDSAMIMEVNPKSLGYRLILRENNRYEIIGLLPEFTCTYGGKFSINHDTVDLQESFILSSDTNLARRYVIDKRLQFLKPLNPTENSIAYNKWWFEIIEIQANEDCNRYTDNYIPKDIEDAINYLDCSIDKQSKEAFKKVPENLATLRLPPETGMVLRNKWGLWQENNVLTNYFHSLGVFHPDDMSSIILLSFHRKLNGKPINLEYQIKKSNEYWKNARLKENEDSLLVNRTYHELKTGDTLTFYLLERNPDGKRIDCYVFPKDIAELNYSNHHETFFKCRGLLVEKRLDKSGLHPVKVKLTDLGGRDEFYQRTKKYRKGDVFEFELESTGCIDVTI
jgi:hypothetical protein